MRRRVWVLALCVMLLLLPAVAFAAENLLPAWDFSADPALPKDWNDEAWYEGADEYAVFYDEAQRAVCIRNDVENDARFCYTVKVKANTCYTLSCLVKTEEVQGGAGANVSVTDTLAASEAVLGTQNWQSVELTGRTGAKQKEITVCVRVGGYGALSAGTAWFKDIALYEVPDTASAVDFDVQREEAEVFTSGKVPYLGAIILSVLLTALTAVLLGRFVIQRKEVPGTAPRYSVFVLLAGAFLLRVLLSLLVYGHPTDIQCFMAWGNALAANGYGAFYTSGMFADYPPGYMHVLGLTSRLANLLGLSYGSDGYVLLTKMPAILCDLLCAYFVYDAAKKRLSERTALWLCALFALNPVVAFVSGGWGQIDSVLTLLLTLSIWLFLQDKRVWAGTVYGLAIAAKPQALMLGPLLAAAYFAAVKNKKDIYKTLAAVLTALGLILLLALPFRSTQASGWLLEKYFSTATSYPYASIEAYNLMALLGGNWASVQDTPFLFSYQAWGTFFILLSVCVSIAAYLRCKKQEGALWLCAAYMLCSIFMLGQYMHERYLYPVLLFLLLAFIKTKDKRLYFVYAWLSIGMLLNALGAFVIIDHPDSRGMQYDTLVLIGSLLNVSGWGYFTYVFVDRVLRGGHAAAFTEEPTFEAVRRETAIAQEEALPADAVFTKRDRLLCFGLTLFYALVALWNLGSLKAPESVWQGKPGDTVTVSLGEGTQVKEIWIFGGISEGAVSVMTDAGVVAEYEQTFDDMFRWVKVPVAAQADSLTLAVTSGRICFHELAVRDSTDVLAKIVSLDAPALTDEQDTVPPAPSYLNGMYFDELYHGRTAYEHLHGLTPYENSHPPLGKVLIMLGVAVCGMNPFGWRITGALLGIAMLPILYVFAKRLFKKSEYAFLATALFALDFMHFTQTRIATIDVYAVFFILLMYDFMYRYFCTDFFRDGLKHTLKPLGLAGLFFGMGAASKWTCIYAGGGLAVILILYLAERYKESRVLLASKDPEEQALGARFWRYTIQTLLWCCAFYILVPLLIYLLSYLPYCLSAARYDFKDILDAQEFMFSYHSRLTATHPYQSAWWQWPLDMRPTWYYVGYDASGTRAGTISAFGNPAVWWVCSFGLIAMVVQLFRNKLKIERGMTVLLVGAAANYLPWVLVPRCTFTYHYFPMVPFIILCTVYLVRDMEARFMDKRVKWVWLGMCAALFVLFYPVISGVMAPVKYIHALEWLPSWTFLGY